MEIYKYISKTPPRTKEFVSRASCIFPAWNEFSRKELVQVVLIGSLPTVLSLDNTGGEFDLTKPCLVRNGTEGHCVCCADL